MSVLKPPTPGEPADTCRAAREGVGTCRREGVQLIVFDVEPGHPHHPHPGRKTTRVCALCADEALELVRDLFDPAAYLVPRSRWGEVYPVTG